MSVPMRTTRRDALESGGVTRRGFLGAVVAAGTLGTGRPTQAGTRQTEHIASRATTSNTCRRLRSSWFSLEDS